MREEPGGSDEAQTIALATTSPSPSPVPAEVAVSPPPPWAGRYTLVRKLAEGGMGEVYVAHDEELDRRVAMKLLRRAAPSAEEQQRMHREAQALARLSHPNVVQVHDVGHHGDQLFVTMELVVGANLRAWWRAAPRGWRDVLGVMLQAGEGLAAAHRAGLVHRDIKPDNILVGDDGRVRVADFGLARPEADAGDVAGATLDEARESGSLLHTPLTEVGHVVGTPAYMAPEQYLHAPVSVRSDVFSFCVVLYEGLHGERPFRGKDWKELAAATLAGRFTPPARDPPVPAWLMRPIARGLAVDPEERYASVEALLEDLRRPLAASRRRWQWFGALAALGVGVALGAAGLRGPAPCAEADADAAALWGEERRSALTAALVAVAPVAGAEISSRLTARLDRHVDDLKRMSRESCLSYQRGELSDNLYDRQRACQGRRRGELEALLAVLAAPDAEVVSRALTAAEGLRDLAGCSDDAALLAQLAPPDAATAEALPALTRRLDRVRALRLAGRYQEADRDVQPLVVEVRTLAHAPLTAEALIERALLSLELAKASSAAEDLLAAVAFAEAAGADELRLAALTGWLRALGHAPDTPRELLAAVEPQALALVERRGATGRKAHGLVLLAAGEAHLERDEFDPASMRLEAALALLGPLGDDVAPELGEVLNDLAIVRIKQRRYADSHAFYQRARRLIEQTQGPHHPSLGFIANNEARAFDKEGDRQAARASFSEALALWEPVYGPDHPNTIIALNHLARVSAELGDDAAARAHAERVLASRERTAGSEHVSVASPLLTLARLDLRGGDLTRARGRGERALALLEGAHGPDSPKLYEVLTLAAQIALADGRVDAALALTERSLAVAGNDPARARARFSRAKIRWQRGEHPAARDDAEAALAEPSIRDEVAAWLAAHRPPR